MPARGGEIDMGQGLWRVLIVGVGSIGERHLRCFKATGRADVGFVEINEKLGRIVANRYGIHACYPDLPSALRDQYDVAVIATPAPWHVPMATTLAEAGIHLLIEKPLSINLDGIERLQQLVHERNLVAAVAYVYRVHPCLAAMKDALAAGRFGKPVEIVAVSGQHFPTYRPAYREIYYADRAQGGGAIQDALTHLVNAGEWLVGPVTRVAVDAAHQILEGVEVEDTVHVLTRHGSVLGCYCLNQHQAPNETTLTVMCTGGTVRFEFHENRWRWMSKPGNAWHDEQIDPLERDMLFSTQANRFLDAVEGKGRVPCSLDEGLQTLRANLAALAGLESGVWQTVGPES
jgi:predicted dehydrogenase